MENVIWDFRNPYEWMQRVRASALPPVIITCAITGGIQSKEANINLPAQSLFSLIGTGPFQLPMNMMGVMMGGHVRVGMEDNTHYRRGQPLKSNAEAVVRVARMARDMNREIATPAQARGMMEISPVPSRY